ncbi:integrating conjugative element protein [Chimaeribacter californicus]|uniref:Integrating conjugative element protein n=1 Tax=Chimaeribacter californicus TaxID=2060067 RepID=A0A2N5E2Y1_9GAMM|nr:integrating conjugative element protein [Chimaeribacter californicus]PLR35047.1 integrating conjugative element protein [Chimaeribacter californicus]
MKRALCSIPLVIAVSLPVSAALTVVADLGGEPTSDYFAAINNPAGEQAPPQSLTTPTVPATVAAMLPVTTPELTPGPVEQQPLFLPGMRATFLIGDDDLSRRWLALRRDRLLQLNAVGYVVNISEASALNTLKAHAEGLELVPVSGSDLATRLGISHYPVLISEKGIEQ